MNLREIAERLVTPGKGILAADESPETAAKRLAAVGVESTEETRRAYRELFFGTSVIERYLSGIILHPESTAFIEPLRARGILPGIKVDEGTAPCPDSPEETITKGLRGLEGRLAAYRALGAQFTKWRSVVRIGDGLPTDACIEKNADDLAAYALASQKAGLTPIVEPEVLLDRSVSLKRSEETLTRTLEAVFGALRAANVDLGSLILKSSMALPGAPKEVAEATIRALHAAVPIEVPGIVFLSGGQKPEEATANLNAIAQREPLPWEIAFSYARALQGPALEIWRGKAENVEAARAEFLLRLSRAVAADRGRL